MAGNHRVRSVETLSCDAGWRNYHFVKITTEDGVVGWSEFDEGFGSPGLGTATRGGGTSMRGSAQLAVNRPSATRAAPR